jgi:uncharacterized protein YndB with AHSA1/START domain
MKPTLKISTPTDREILIERMFEAPRPLVWNAMTSPELLRRWLFGPPGWEMTACANDLRAGGAFHCAWSGPNGAALSMRGVYREIVPLERVVRTESFDTGCDSQAGQQLTTMVLKEAGKTYLTLTVLFPSKEARDGTLASGMEHGMRAGYDRLDEVLTGMVAAALPAKTVKP